MTLDLSSLESSLNLKKAGGDAKKKDQKYEPFAYMPLQRKNLNKRNKSKAKTQFKAIVTHKPKR